VFFSVFLSGRSPFKKPTPQKAWRPTGPGRLGTLELLLESQEHFLCSRVVNGRSEDPNAAEDMEEEIAWWFQCAGDENVNPNEIEMEQLVHIYC